MRTLQENDELFLNLMRLKTTFYWKGHELSLNGDHIKVFTEEAFQELLNHTSEDIHKLIIL